jgi:outer membrane protein assembly factor BamB
MKRPWLLLVLVGLAGVNFVCWCVVGISDIGPAPNSPEDVNLSGRVQPFLPDLDEGGVPGSIGHFDGEVSGPAPFATPDRKIKGWKVTVKREAPLLTAAVANGKVLLGGGFASRSVWAFDAVTGAKVWEYDCNDNGPTALSVADGYVSFTTESCELEVLTLKGERVWKKWLGDPLLGMPALDRGKVYAAYFDSNGDKQHHLGCFDVKNGKPLWKASLSGPENTTPVVPGDRV